MRLLGSFFGVLALLGVGHESAFAGYDNLSQNSDGNPVLMSMHDTCIDQNGYSIAVRFVPSTQEYLKEFWIKAAVTGGGTLEQGVTSFDWEINVWDSAAALHASPFLGNLYHNYAESADLGSEITPVGYERSGKPTYAIGFAFPSLLFHESGEYWIGVRAVGSTGVYGICDPATGLLKIQESEACAQTGAGDSGKIFSENSFHWAPDYWAYTSAVYTAGYGCGDPATKARSFGDMNGDGATDIADYTLFLSAILDPEFENLHPGTSIQLADFNMDGVIDSSDYSVYMSLI